MSDQNKFEKMLELLVNEDKAAAEELFHEIVVEKSRDIYESLLEDEAEVDEADDEEVDESDEDLDEADDEEVDESDEDLDENFSLDTFEVEADDEPFGGDKTDDLANDLGMEMPGEEGDDDMGDAEDDADVEDRVEDLEDALDDLKAEFEKMMAGDDDGEDDGEEADDDAEGDMGMDAEEEPEEESYAFEAADEDDDESDEEVEEDTTEKSASETMREYVEKVTATMGDNGVNGKSAVAKPNNMGGTSGNLNQAGSDASSETGAGKKIAGSALNDQNAKDIGTGNVNVPGGKAAKAGKTVPAGHGAEKKGAGETADKAAGSTLNKLSKRAK
jgi:hypothetical protein